MDYNCRPGNSRTITPRHYGIFAGADKSSDDDGAVGKCSNIPQVEASTLRYAGITGPGKNTLGRRKGQSASAGEPRSYVYPNGNPGRSGTPEGVTGRRLVSIGFREVKNNQGCQAASKWTTCDVEFIDTLSRNYSPRPHYPQFPPRLPSSCCGRFGSSTRNTISS